MYQKCQISHVLKLKSDGHPSSVSVISNSEQHNLNHYPDIQVDVGRVVSQSAEKATKFCETHTTEISVNHTTEISVKSSAKAEDTS